MMTATTPTASRTDGGSRPLHPTPVAKVAILTRLRRLEGQVRGLQRMVDGDAGCGDVLTQLAAVVSASRATGLLVLEEHMRGGIPGAAPRERETAAELTDAIAHFTRMAG